MLVMFRTMKADPEGLPIVGDRFLELGVRAGGLNPDVHAAADGTVGPGEGMSVFNDPRKLPKSMRPRSLGGESAHPVFSLGAERVSTPLVLNWNKPPHGLVEPSCRMALHLYRGALAATRADWRRAHG